MKETTQQIEDNINQLLDIYDSAMKSAKESKGIAEENEHKKVALQTTDCIEHEMKKLESLRSFNPEIRVTSSKLDTCLDVGRELSH